MESVLVEPRATSTAQNLDYSRRLLAERGIPVRSVLIMSRPYQQRRAFATSRLVWPEAEGVCASDPLGLDEYVRSIDDVRRVVDMLVGHTQRIEVCAERGFAISQELPGEVRVAFDRLVVAGYTRVGWSESGYRCCVSVCA